MQTHGVVRVRITPVEHAHNANRKSPALQREEEDEATDPVHHCPVSTELCQVGTSKHSNNHQGCQWWMLVVQRHAQRRFKPAMLLLIS